MGILFRLLSTVLAFTGENYVTKGVLRLLNFKKLPNLMNFMLNDPVSFIHKIGVLPQTQRRALESFISKTVQSQFGGAITLKIDLKLFSENLKKSSKLSGDFYSLIKDNTYTKNKVPQFDSGNAFNQLDDKKSITKQRAQQGQIQAFNSSWITAGRINSVNGLSANVTIYMGEKGYDFPNFPLWIYRMMALAVGRNGSGAGSILWSSFWGPFKSKTGYIRSNTITNQKRARR